MTGDEAWNVLMDDGFTSRGSCCKEVLVRPCEKKAGQKRRGIYCHEWGERDDHEAQRGKTLENTVLVVVVGQRQDLGANWPGKRGCLTSAISSIFGRG